MSWLIKNWYILLIAIAIVIWLTVEPTAENLEQSSIDLTEETDLGNTIEEEIEEPKKLIYMVDIKGAIKNPGVYQVNESDRVKDVIETAGGFLENAEAEAINLAERIYDEMVIYVPTAGEDKANIELNSTSNDTNKIKINTATAEEIQTIPGIGEVKANEIVTYRETYGRFEKMEDLTNVSGIGEKTVEKIEAYVRIP